MESDTPLISLEREREGERDGDRLGDFVSFLVVSWFVFVSTSDITNHELTQTQQFYVALSALKDPL